MRVAFAGKHITEFPKGNLKLKRCVNSSYVSKCWVLFSNLFQKIGILLICVIFFHWECENCGTRNQVCFLVSGYTQVSTEYFPRILSELEKAKHPPMYFILTKLWWTQFAEVCAEVCSGPQTTRIAIPCYRNSGLIQNYEMKDQWFYHWFICCKILTCCYPFFLEINGELKYMP